MSEPDAPLTRRSANGRRSSNTRVGQSGPPKTGLGGAFAKHPTAWLAATIGVVFLLLATGAVLAGAAIGNSPSKANPTSSNSASAGRAAPAQIPPATHLRTCSVAGPAADGQLAGLSGAVVNATSGELMFDRSSATASPAAGISEVLTASAALAILGPDYQMSTRVYDGGSPGTIVLVGGGDATLSALPSGQDSVYSGAPKLDDLATQVNAAYATLHPGVPITQIVLDSTMWKANDNWDSSWKRSWQTGGYLSEVTALQVDGDRSNPKAQTSYRSNDPIGHAGQLFESAMGLSGVTFTQGSAITSKPLLGQVKSQPLSTLIKQMLASGDLTLGETMARVVSQTMGLTGSSASLAQAIPSALAIYGVDTSQVKVRDGSGLSTLNAIPPAFLAQFMVKVQLGGANLNYVYNSLSVAGKPGSLSSRFSGGNAAARGHVFAKAGSLDNERSLAGIITAADGTQLTFAFYAIRSGIGDASNKAIDTLVTAIYNCGNNLANN